MSQSPYDTVEMKPICREKFSQIMKRLDAGDDKFREHATVMTNSEKDLVRLMERLEALATAVNNTNRIMLWFGGVIITSLLSFFIWYVQRAG